MIKAETKNITVEVSLEGNKANLCFELENILRVFRKNFSEEEVEKILNNSKKDKKQAEEDAIEEFKKKHPDAVDFLNFLFGGDK